jgi:hypothetical protein
MSDSLKTRALNAIKVAIAFTPWLISMYVLYWLEYGEVWTTQTAHRGKTSGAILVVGMGLSFLVHSSFTKEVMEQ